MSSILNPLSIYLLQRATQEGILNKEENKNGKPAMEESCI